MYKSIKLIYLIFLCCSSVFGATYYVSPSGNDSNEGTSESKPFKIVQFAIDQMKAGDTLIILDGV